MAIQLTKAVFGARIIVLDLGDDKLKIAKENGADETINSKSEDPIKRVMELTDNKGADAVIDFVNASKTVEADMQLLRRRAKVVLVGLFGGELKLNLDQCQQGHIALLAHILEIYRIWPNWSHLQREK